MDFNKEPLLKTIYFYVFHSLLNKRISEQLEFKIQSLDFNAVHFLASSLTVDII